MVRSTKSTAAPTTDKPAAAKKTKAPKETSVAAPAAEQALVADAAEQIPLLGKLGEFAEKLQQMTAFISSLKT